MEAIYDLKKARAEVEAQFKTLEAQRQALLKAAQGLQQQLNGVLTEMARFQGEYRMLERLDKELAPGGPDNGLEQEAVTGLAKTEVRDGS